MQIALTPQSFPPPVSPYAYVPMVDGKPLYVPTELGGTGRAADYTPGHPPQRAEGSCEVNGEMRLIVPKIEDTCTFGIIRTAHMESRR